MSRKAKVNNELIERLKREGTQNLSRTELRALERKGYVTKTKMATGNGHIRYEYKADMRII